MSRLSLFDLENHGDFIQRHIGPEIEHQITMARAIGYESLDALIDDTVPARHPSRAAHATAGSTN